MERPVHQGFTPSVRAGSYRRGFKEGDNQDGMQRRA